MHEHLVYLGKCYDDVMLSGLVLCITKASLFNRLSSNNSLLFQMGDSGATGAGEPAKPATLKDQFAAFSRFGDTSSDGKQITLSNSDKWMKQAHVIDGKKITTTDTSICFKKLFK